MNAFPESPNRSEQFSVADRIEQQAKTLSSTTPNDATVYAMTPDAEPPAQGAPDAIVSRPSGSSTAVEAVSRVGQNATDVAAGATALTCGATTGWMIGKEVAADMARSTVTVGDLPIVGDLAAKAGGQMGGAAGVTLAGAALNVPQPIVERLCRHRSPSPRSPYGGGRPSSSTASPSGGQSHNCWGRP